MVAKHENMTGPSTLLRVPRRGPLTAYASPQTKEHQKAQATHPSGDYLRANPASFRIA